VLCRARYPKVGDTCGESLGTIRDYSFRCISLYHKNANFVFFSIFLLIEIENCGKKWYYILNYYKQVKSNIIKKIYQKNVGVNVNEYTKLCRVSFFTINNFTDS